MYKYWTFGFNDKGELEIFSVNGRISKGMLEIRYDEQWWQVHKEDSLPEHFFFGGHGFWLNKPECVNTARDVCYRVIRRAEWEIEVNNRNLESLEVNYESDES